MNGAIRAFSTISLLLINSFSQAGVGLFAARVGAEDVESVSKFYSTAFNMLEVNRVQLPIGPEIFLNFGETTEAAKSNPAPQIAIIQRAPNAPKDSVSHIMLQVTDMNDALIRVKDSGGSLERGPIPFGNSGLILAWVVDPAGNRIELLQRSKP